MSTAAERSLNEPPHKASPSPEAAAAAAPASTQYTPAAAAHEHPAVASSGKPAAAASGNPGDAGPTDHRAAMNLYLMNQSYWTAAAQCVSNSLHFLYLASI